MNKRIVVTGVVFILFGIMLGAFGAHGLKEMITDVKLNSFETGVRYQMYHGIAFLVMGLNADKIKKGLTRFYLLILLGTILFSGSIYLLSIQSIIGLKLSVLGPVTPLGGLLLIVGWFYLLVSIRKNNIS